MRAKDRKQAYYFSANNTINQDGDRVIREGDGPAQDIDKDSNLLRHHNTTRRRTNYSVAKRARSPGNALVRFNILLYVYYYIYIYIIVEFIFQLSAYRYYNNYL